MRVHLLFWIGFVLVVSPVVVEALDHGNTTQPYIIVSGRSLAFANLTKNDLGQRCTVYLKPIAAHDLSRGQPPGMVVTKGSRYLVNGEFNELGKHFILVVWYDNAKTFCEPFPISEADIDHIVLEK